LASTLVEEVQDSHGPSQAELKQRTENNSKERKGKKKTSRRRRSRIRFFITIKKPTLLNIGNVMVNARPMNQGELTRYTTVSMV
jgi:hypothetical protein